MQHRAIVALFIALAGVSALLAAPRAAQAGPGEQLAEIAGIRAECRDFRGRAVQTVQVADLGDVGRAWVINTVPYIIMDPHVLRRLPRTLQIFFYAHECAHHVLGHWFDPTMESEKQADCWAVRYGRDKGLFTRQDVADFAPWFASSKGSPLGHLPGPERAKYLLTCFDSDTADTAANATAPAPAPAN